jgi:hypothetical protein
MPSESAATNLKGQCVAGEAIIANVGQIGHGGRGVIDRQTLRDEQPKLGR